MATDTTNHSFYEGPLTGARILVVDDEALTVRSISRVLRACRADPVCCGGLPEARQTVLEASMPFDAAVVDFQLVEGDGVEIIELLRTGRYPCATLMITGSHDPEKGRRALQAGADDFMLKPIDVVGFIQGLEELVGRTHARRRRIAGTRYDPRQVEANAFQQAHPVAHLENIGSDLLRGRHRSQPDLLEQADRIAKTGKLSKREREVLIEILKGRKNTDISGELGITTRTVKFHVRNVLKKCDVDSRTGLTGLLWGERPAPPRGSKASADPAAPATDGPADASSDD